MLARVLMLACVAPARLAVIEVTQSAPGSTTEDAVFRFLDVTGVRLANLTGSSSSIRASVDVETASGSSLDATASAIPALRAALQMQNTTLQTQISAVLTTLQMSNTALQEQVTALQSQNTALQSQVVALQAVPPAPEPLPIPSLPRWIRVSHTEYVFRSYSVVGGTCYQRRRTWTYAGERQLRYPNGSMTTQRSTTTTTHTCDYTNGCTPASPCALTVTSAVVQGSTISNILADVTYIVKFNVQEGW